MKDPDIMSLADVKKLYKELYESVTRESVKTTLKDMHEICEKIVDANATPSVPAVVKALASKGVIVSERSIYNRRQGKNPYPMLIDGWIKVVQGKQLGIQAVVKASTEPQPDSGITIRRSNALITEDDLLKISDPVLRYKISVLFGQMTSLTKQNTALRELRELPAIHPDYQGQPSAKDIDKHSLPAPQLDSLDVEILSNFLGGQNGQLYFNDEGTLYAAKALRTHTPISDPGLKEVIEKLLPKKLIE